MKFEKNDVWVGSFAFIGLLAILFLALKASNLLSFSLDSTYRVSGSFDNIGGLKPQAPVKSAGVVIGRVKAIQFDPQSYQAKAILDLDEKNKFPKDSTLKILTSGLLGEQYISLEVGGAEDFLQDGDAIASTQSAVILENLIGQFLYNSNNSKNSDNQDVAGDKKK